MQNPTFNHGNGEILNLETSADVSNIYDKLV
jgi:hypothetical protein